MHFGVLNTFRQLFNNGNCVLTRSPRNDPWCGSLKTTLSCITSTNGDDAKESDSDLRWTGDEAKCPYACHPAIFWRSPPPLFLSSVFRALLLIDRRASLSARRWFISRCAVAENLLRRTSMLIFGERRAEGHATWLNGWSRRRWVHAEYTHNGSIVNNFYSPQNGRST